MILEREQLGPGTGRVVMNTNCNTWGCLGCRDRLKRLFQMRVETGLLTLGRCAFITVTYKAESSRLQTADIVGRDWRALCNRLRRWEPEIARMEWLRVMELTEAGTPHHHIVMGQVPTKAAINCWGKNSDFQIQRYDRRFDSCECMAHRIAYQWRKLTGDSRIVHANPVSEAAKAASYLCKYLDKDFDGTRAANLGMARRWSSSRGWPGRGRLRLLQTERGWDRVSFANGHLTATLLGGSDSLTARNGNDLTARIEKRASRQRFISIGRKLTDG